MNRLISEVSVFKTKQLQAAKALRQLNAPIDQINAREVAARNAVAMLESYVCFTNMAASNYGVNKQECLEIANHHLQKLTALMAA